MTYHKAKLLILSIYFQLETFVTILTVFQLGIFLRTLRPARTVLRPARLHSALPELGGKKKKM